MPAGRKQTVGSESPGVRWPGGTWSLRRTLHVIALLIAILCGSIPGLRLLGSTRTEPCPCCAGPCRMPERAPAAPCGPAAPCHPGATAPVAALAAACSAVQTASRPRTEPSPLPRFLLAAREGRFLDAGPSVLARPGPVPPFDSGPTRLAKLSLLRI